MSLAFALIVIGCILLLIAAHPFATYPLSLMLASRKGARKPEVDKPEADNRHPAAMDFSICVCAYNEERVIEAKVLNLLALRERGARVEILFYVDGATDGTADILRRYESQIRLIVSPQRLGKTRGMNLLVAQARAEIVVFSDANVMLDAHCLEILPRYFSDRSVGCVCGNLIYTNGDASVTASTGSLYWRFEESVKRLEERTGSIMGADGSLFSIRRSLHCPPPPHIIDDMYVSLMILCGGHRIVQATDVRAYEQSVTSTIEEYRRKVRIACQAFNAHKTLWPHLRRLDALTLYKYISHKLIRWFSPFLLLLSALTFFAAAASAGYSRVAATLFVGAAIVALLGYRYSVKPIAQIVDVLIAFAGTGFGVWRSMRGDLYQTWRPASSIRK